MLINRPRRKICKVGNYDITVSSEGHLEDSVEFDKFCNEFKGVIIAIVSASKTPAKCDSITGPTQAIEGVS